MFFGWGFCNIVLALITFSPNYMSTWFEDLTWTEYLKKNGISYMYFIYSILAGNIQYIINFYIFT